MLTVTVAVKWLLRCNEIPSSSVKRVNVLWKSARQRNEHARRWNVTGSSDVGGDWQRRVGRTCTGSYLLQRIEVDVRKKGIQYIIICVWKVVEVVGRLKSAARKVQRAENT